MKTNSPLILGLVALALGFICPFPACAESKSDFHQIGEANDLEGLKPAEDPNYDISLSICGPGLTDNFKAGYRIGHLRAKQGKREWIRPIDSSIDPKSITPLKGCRELILQNYRVTEALNDQIDGFNQAMWGALILDHKKANKAVKATR